MASNPEAALAAAHALATAVCYRADDDLVTQLLKEAYDAGGQGFEIALGASHVCLRMALDQAEQITPGFRERFLTAIGRAWVETN